MHPLEALLRWLIFSDLIWAALVSLWVIVALPISYLIIRKKDRR